MVDEVVSKLGGLDVAFCNAGICMNVPAEEMTLEQWNKVMNINLTGGFLTSQAAGKYMLEKGNGMAPMGRMGRPEELQSICVYLAGDTSSFTTGADFVIDGAFTCF